MTLSPPILRYHRNKGLHRHAAEANAAIKKAVPIPAGGYPAWPESARVNLNTGEVIVHPMSSRDDFAFCVENVPIRDMHHRRPVSQPIPYDPVGTWGLKILQGGLSETAVSVPGLAATTPILGQYAPTFGWPDDWGWYWEYLDARLFVPEAAFAVKLKTRLVWKQGWELDGDKAVVDKMMKVWKKQRIERQLRKVTGNAIAWGNGYALNVDNSEAVWDTSGESEYDYALTQVGVLYGMPRPLLRYKPPSLGQFYGLMPLDPRTIRIQAHPQRFDTETGDVWTEKFIQRRWAGPLAPTSMDLPQGQLSEIDIHPDQMFYLQFNPIGGGLYGYSLFREVLMVIKGYMLMQQFLPTIVGRRADPGLVFKFGGNVKEAGIESSVIMQQPEVDAKAELYKNRNPGEDVYGNMLLSIEEMYKSQPTLEGINEFIRTYKERVLLGLGVPMSVAVLSQAGAEIKWGALNYEVLEDEITEYQQVEADEINQKLIPRLTNKEVDFQFNPVHAEDWRADAEKLMELAKMQAITIEYMLQRLRMPPEARVGTFYQAPVKPDPGFGREKKIVRTDRGRRYEIETVMEDEPGAKRKPKPKNLSR